MTSLYWGEEGERGKGGEEVEVIASARHWRAGASLDTPCIRDVGPCAPCIASNMSPGRHEKCTMIIVHVSCATELMNREIQDEVRGANPLGKQGGLGSPASPQWCPEKNMFFLNC